jgi:hypothetical protein
MPLFGRRSVSVEFTKRAEEGIARMLSEAPVKQPLLGIQWASTGKDEKWILGVYERENFREGWIGVAGDLEFAVIQEWVLDMLENATVDLDDNDGRSMSVTARRPT